MITIKTLFWFVLGIGVGVIVAHLVDKDPRGHGLLADIDARISEFTDRIGEAYRAQEARFDGFLEDAKGAASSREAVEATQAARAAADKLAD